jgi:hypothetical protein
MGDRTDGTLDVGSGSTSGTFAGDGSEATHTAAAPGSTNVALDLADYRPPWEYLEIRVSGGSDTTLVDSVKLIVP